MKKLFLFFFALVVSIGSAWADKTIYLNPGLCAVDNPVYAAYVWDAGGNSWISLTNVTGTAYYKATIPDKWEKMILVRLDPSKTIGWDAKWQQTDDIVLSGIYDYTLFKITDWNGSPMGNSGYNVSHMNLSLLGSVLAKSDSQGTSPVGNAIDGNKGTNWETKHGVDDAFLIIDLGANVTFNTVKMLWQNAYGKAYNIYAVADGAALTDGVPTFTDADKVLVVNETINGSFPYEQTKRTASDVTARYIKWEGVERAMPYGYNMYELQFYNIGSQTLESLNLVVPNAARQDATLSACKVGENITINYEAFDAYGFNYYGTEGISYNATNGTITNAGVFTPSAAGPCTITATLLDKEATATIYAYTGDDLLLNKVASTNEGASGADLFTNGNWGDRGGLGSAIPAWTQYDLEAYYTIDFVMLKQEQANAKNYKIQFSHDGETWVDAYERTNVAGMQGDVWDYFYGNTTQNTDVRFIRFYSTEAATGYGISIYEIAAYGTKTGDVADNVAPVINTATVNATALGVTFTLKATDETASNISYTITDGANVYNTNGANGTEIKYTVYGMAAATHSGVQIVANDGHNDSDPTILADFVVPAIPDIPAITETETYLLWDGNNGGKKNGFNFYTWDGGTGTDITINEKPAYQVSNFKWFGSQFTLFDATPYDFLELDVFPSIETTTLAIVPINAKTEGDGNQNEKGQQFSLTPGEWNKLKINIADFIAENKTTMTKFYQIKFVSKIANKGADGATDGFVSGNGTETFVIGNIYAYKESGDDNEKPEMVSAALASKTHNSATLTLKATDNNSKVKFHVVDATNSINVTTGLADQGTDFEYTVTGLTAETDYNFTVTAEDAAGNISENNKVVAVTTDAAPTGQELVNGDHKVLLNGYHYEGTENYELIITSDEVMTGLGGSYWNINGVGGTRVDQNLTISDGGKKLTITATSNQDPQLYTPLYVMMPGEVNFGQPVIDWQIKTAAPTEGYYIIGTMNEWNINNNYKLTLNETAATTEYYFPSLALTTTSQFKVVYSADGTEKNTYYPDGIGNNYGENGEIASDGNYTIFFRPNGDGGDDWFYNVIYVTSMIDAGVDQTTGAHILTGVWDAAKFASIDAMDKAAAYDLTQLSFTGQLDMIGKTANPYCMFITSAPGKVNRNEVVWDEANSRYNGYALNFAEPADATAPFDINTSIAPIHVVNPFFQRLFTSANNYFTMTIPFDYTLPATDKAWTMSATSSESGLSVTFTEVAAGSTLTKNTPYLYFSSVGGVTMPDPGEVIIDWAAQTVGGTDASFIANYSRKVTDGTENIYVLPGVVKETALQFQKAGEVSIRPFRAYLQAASAPAKINVFFNDATGIHTATTEQLEGIFNIYSIDGKLVRQNSNSKMGLNKGVYIINGKKVVVK